VAETVAETYTVAETVAETEIYPHRDTVSAETVADPHTRGRVGPESDPRTLITLIPIAFTSFKSDWVQGRIFCVRGR
jgi:hypothetical protein